MYIFYDEDEFETIIHSTPCTSCGGNLGKCRGVGCNGSSGMGSRRRAPSEVRAIKFQRQCEADKNLLLAAQQALKRIKAREGEDVGTWADKLADDLARFTD